MTRLVDPAAELAETFVKNATEALIAQIGIGQCKDGGAQPIMAAIILLNKSPVA
jgi:hypothetical protein